MNKQTESDTELRISWKKLYDELDYKLSELGRQIENSDGPVVIQPPFIDGEPVSLNEIERRERVSRCIRQMEYIDGQDNTGTIDFPGLVAISPEILENVKNINELKDKLSDLQYTMKRIITVVRSGLKERDLLRDTWIRCHLPRLHPLQLTRRIPYVSDTLLSAGFSVYQAKKLRHHKVRDVIHDLEEAGHKHYPLHKVMASLPPEEWIAEHYQNLPRRIRCNVKLEDDKGKIYRKQIYNALPVFFPYSEHHPVPVIKDIEQVDRTKPQRRIPGRRLEPDPITEHHRYFRYRPAFRQYGEEYDPKFFSK